MWGYLKDIKNINFIILFRNVPDIYSDALISEGVLSRDEVSQIIGDHSDWLNEHFKQIETFKPERTNLKENWAALKEPSSSITYWDTGLPSGKTNPQKVPKVAFLSRFLRTHLITGYLHYTILKNLVRGTEEIFLEKQFNNFHLQKE